MAPVAEAAVTPRLKTRYHEEIAPALVKRFGYSSAMEVPRITRSR